MLALAKLRACAEEQILAALAVRNLLLRDLEGCVPFASLGTVCLVLSGTTPPTAVERYWGGRIVWVTPSDLGKPGKKFIESSERSVTEDALRHCNLAVAPPGSIIISSRAPIGHVAVAGVPLCVNQGCKLLIPSDEVDTM
jgi:type I restriction enzyme S subunit